MSKSDFEIWHEKQVIENIPVNRTSNREVYTIENIPVYLTETIPHNVFKHSYNYVYIDIQLPKEKLIEMGVKENITGVWYGELYTVAFGDDTNTYDDLEKAYNFIMKNIDIIKEV